MYNSPQNHTKVVKHEWSNEELLQYLDKQLPNDERADLEEDLLDDPFLSDAVDGLQNFDNTKQIQMSLLQVNNGLKQRLADRKKALAKGKIKDLPWIGLAILLVLALCTAGYFIITLYLQYRTKI